MRTETQMTNEAREAILHYLEVADNLPDTKPDEMPTNIWDEAVAAQAAARERLDAALALIPAKAPTTQTADGLAEAWAEAEALVGPGSLMLWASFTATPDRNQVYVAKPKAYSMTPGGVNLPQVYCYGPTPQAALRALINDPSIAAALASNGRS